MKFKDFDELVRMVKGKSNRIVSPGANNAEVIEAIKIADGYGLISGGVLIGDTAQIKSLAAEAKLDLKKFHIKDDQKFIYDFLVAKRVLLVQGRGFNWPEPDHFRIVFLPSVEDLKTALDGLEDFLQDYRQA